MKSIIKIISRQNNIFKWFFDIIFVDNLYISMFLRESEPAHHNKASTPYSKEVHGVTISPFLFKKTTYKNINVCAFAMFRYKDIVIKNVIAELKNYARSDITDFIGKKLAKTVLQNLNKNSEHFLPLGLNNSPIVVTYIPLSPSRLIERGFNQNKMIAEGFFNHFKVLKPVYLKSNVYFFDLLEKNRNTSNQSSLRQKDRLNNLKDCFSVSINAKNELIEMVSDGPQKQIDIIIIDDVTTTGHTFETATRSTIDYFASDKIKENQGEIQINNVVCLAVAH